MYVEIVRNRYNAPVGAIRRVLPMNTLPEPCWAYRREPDETLVLVAPDATNEPRDGATSAYAAKRFLLGRPLPHGFVAIHLASAMNGVHGADGVGRASLVILAAHRAAFRDALRLEGEA